MIVADTGPLNYLVQIGNEHVLPLLFEKVYIPFEVAEELRRIGTPPVVHAWLAHPPPWLVLLPPGPRIVLKTGLHSGELAAIALAERMGHQTLLIDERLGRDEAVGRGIPVIGTVAVLYTAGTMDLIDFETQLRALLQKGFFLSEKLRDHYLARWRDFLAAKTPRKPL